MFKAFTNPALTCGHTTQTKGIILCRVKQSLAKKQASGPPNPKPIAGHHVFVTDQFAAILDRPERGVFDLKPDTRDEDYDDAITRHVYAVLSRFDNGAPYPSHRVFRAIFIGREAYRASCAASNSRLCRSKWPKLQCEVSPSDINDKTSESPYGR
jgi:hypothetical protein